MFEVAQCGLAHNTVLNTTSPFKYLPYNMASVCMCVRACAVEIKPGMLRDACFIDVCVWTQIRFALQDGGFQSSNGVIPYGLFDNSIDG